MIKTIDQMDTFELSRWYALMEAVDIIASECSDRGVEFDTLKMSPLGIEKFIESTCDIYAKKIEEDHAKEDIKLSNIQKKLISQIKEKVLV